MKSQSKVPPDAVDIPAPVFLRAGALDEWLAEAGHELRNPLTSILAFADALHDEVFGPLNEAQKQGLLTIKDCVQKETLLIADLIDLRKLEAGLAPLRPGECRVAEVAEVVMAKMAEQVKSRSVQLSTGSCSVDLRVAVDAVRLGQVITHLLMAGILAADVNGSVRLSISALTGRAGLCLQVGVIPPHGEPAEGVPSGPSDADVEKAVRKLSPVGQMLLKAILAQHGGSLAYHNGEAGGLCLLAVLPCGLL
ncbi:MAG: hypothetical protein JWO94_249 [Verrucomicrobiaceae bacterium]|nr:hypothetical protein [Verrucomicrobiaceae bacterium]